MNTRMHVVAITAASAADVLRISDAAAMDLLERAAEGQEVEKNWSAPDGMVEGEQDTNFLSVAGFPAMLAFREELLAATGLELYLEGGEFLPVKTSRGRFLLWHLLAGQVINCEARNSSAGDGTGTGAGFVRHRLPGSCALFSTPRIYRTQLLVQARTTELPPSLGGPEEADAPPPQQRTEDWRSFLLEYTWRGWTGLEFEIVWRSDSADP